MSLEFHNGGLATHVSRDVAPWGDRCQMGTRARSLSELYQECDSEFSISPNTRSEGWGVWVRRLADPGGVQHSEAVTTMQVKAEEAVQGYVERRSREGKCYRSVDLYVKGRDPGGCCGWGSPDDQMPLIEICKQAEGKQAGKSQSKCGIRTNRTGVSSICTDWKFRSKGRGRKVVDFTIIPSCGLITGLPHRPRSRTAMNCFHSPVTSGSSGHLGLLLSRTGRVPRPGDDTVLTRGQSRTHRLSGRATFGLGFPSRGGGAGSFRRLLRCAVSGWPGGLGGARSRRRIRLWPKCPYSQPDLAAIKTAASPPTGIYSYTFNGQTYTIPTQYVGSPTTALNCPGGKMYGFPGSPPPGMSPAGPGNWWCPPAPAQQGIAPPTQASAQQYLLDQSLTAPLSIEQHTTPIGTTGTTQPADTTVSQPVGPIEMPTTVKSKPVPAGDIIVVDSVAPPPSTPQQNTQQQTTTTTTTATQNPDGSTTKQEETEATTSCSAGTHENRTFGTVLQAHQTVWASSGLLRHSRISSNP